MPDQVHLFVKHEPEASASYVANQFKGYTSGVLREEFGAPALPDAHAVVVVVLRGIGRRGECGYGGALHRHPVGTSVGEEGEGGAVCAARMGSSSARRPSRRRQCRGCFSDHCSLYNGALQERRAAYRQVSKTGIRYGDQSAQLTGGPGVRPATPGPLVVLHPGRPRCGAWTRRSPRSSGGSRAGEKPGCPRFRGVNWFDTVEFPKDFGWLPLGLPPPTTRSPASACKGVGHVRVHQHRPVNGPGQDDQRPARGRAVVRHPGR